jgi:hypothetical protein
VDVCFVVFMVQACLIHKPLFQNANKMREAIWAWKNIYELNECPHANRRAIYLSIFFFFLKLTRPLNSSGDEIWHCGAFFTINSFTDACIELSACIKAHKQHSRSTVSLQYVEVNAVE